MATNYLLRRESRYYFRMKVPVDLREELGKKEIKNSLGTGERREALRLVKLEAVKAQALFDDTRRKMVQRVAPNPAKVRIGEGEALALVARWFQREEEEAEIWLEDNLDIFHRPDDLREVLENLHLEAFIYSGGGQAGCAAFRGENGHEKFRQILHENSVEFDGTHDAFKRLAAVARKATVAHLERDIARLNRTAPLETLPLYRPLGGENTHGISSPLETTAKPSATLGDLLDLFASEQKSGKRADSTIRTYHAPIRLLKEELGENLPLAQIDRAKMAIVRDLLLQLPANAKQHFPGKTLRQASAIAKREGRPPIGPKTAENYFRNITAIFNFAVDAELLAKSPASSKWLKQSFDVKTTGKKRPVFTAETLRPLFLALANHPGVVTRNVKRESGRFWVPLLGLFHGFRLNEACQIYSEDVFTREGLLCIEIRDSRADGSACEKRLKNASSARVVPVHPALLELGFASYVERRKKDTTCPRLFADLESGRTGYFSNSFSKWFKRFIRKILGRQEKLTFHCFRHTWRDAARAAKIQGEIVRRLGGWTEGRNVEAGYGHGHPLSLLRDELAKISFPGIELLKPAKKPR